jgi:hypothetical protein
MNNRMPKALSKCLPPEFMQWVIVIMWSIWTIFNSLYMAINLPTYHLDGAFQTASGLYRLEAGQFPGKDFYPYLGIMPLYALYPAFKLLGSDLSASVFSAYFLSCIVKMLPIAMVWQLIWRPKSLKEHRKCDDPREAGGPDVLSKSAAPSQAETKHKGTDPA